MKFLYYLGAIGQPNFNDKNNILLNNLLYIYSNINQDFDLMINTYQKDEYCLEIFYYNRDNLPFLKNIYIYKEKGILSELWINNPNNKFLKRYDYILFILDDVEIINFNIKKCIKIKKKYNIDILSPKVIDATWFYMYQYSGSKLAFTNRLEMFCFLLTPNDLLKYLKINDIKNPGIWGVDLLCSYFNIKTAIYYDSIVHHKLPRTQNRDNSEKNMIIYLNKYGFSSIDDVFNKYPDDIKNIIDIK